MSSERAPPPLTTAKTSLGNGELFSQRNDHRMREAHQNLNRFWKHNQFPWRKASPSNPQGLPARRLRRFPAPQSLFAAAQFGAPRRRKILLSPPAFPSRRESSEGRRRGAVEEVRRGGGGSGRWVGGGGASGGWRRRLEGEIGDRYETIGGDFGGGSEHGGVD